MQTRVLLRRAALVLIALALVLAGSVFLMLAIYEGFLLIAPPAAAALAVAALSFGAGGAIVAILANAGGYSPPPAAAAPLNSNAGLANSVMSVAKLSIVAKLLRARPLSIMGAAVVAGALAAWATRAAGEPDEDEKD